ncbi:hypothetical protein NE237_013163 [Protea cynaroides]|uniref:S-adenosyl-L-methionine-dependent methyltransferase n=1 Tax=Protea cynaroides TaxID=273540 RepID=A0A9Q0H1I1_9MAGN|nr:hypothetical protein NE237_013163 [Protea cynaroides]
MLYPLFKIPELYGSCWCDTHMIFYHFAGLAKHGEWVQMPSKSLFCLNRLYRVLPVEFLASVMGWSPSSATNAYLDTLKLCRNHLKSQDSWETPELQSNEFISALAAGMSAQLIVEISSGEFPSTIALAVAARQTGGRLVCILPEPETLAESTQAIKESGLNDLVEFKVGDPAELLPNYNNIDFSLIDCKTDNYMRLLNLLDVNPRKSVVVANNLVEGRKGLEGHFKVMKDKAAVKSVKHHPIGKGMEVTMIGRSNKFRRGRKGVSIPQAEKNGNEVRRTGKSEWIVRIDEDSGEEHLFRVPLSH